MNEFLTQLAKRIERFTGCVDVRCSVHRESQMLYIVSGDGYCRITLQRLGTTLREVYGRLSQAGITLEERASIVRMLTP